MDDLSGRRAPRAKRMSWFRPRDTSLGVVANDEDVSGTSRRSFLRSSGGYAASAAFVGVPAAVLLEGDAEAAGPVPKATANPTSPPPPGPVMAYVHNVKEGTVVIVSGNTERTVRDHALVHTLLNAPAPKKSKRRTPIRKQVG